MKLLPSGTQADSVYLDWVVGQTPVEYRQLRFPPDPSGRYSKAGCLVPGCPRPRNGVESFCRPHVADYRASSCETLDAFLSVAKRHRDVTSRKKAGGWTGRGIIDLAPAVSEVLRAELCFVIARKASGDYGAPFVVGCFNAFVRKLADLKIHSIREVVAPDVSASVLSGSNSYRSAFAGYMREFPIWLDEAAGVKSGRRRLGRRRGGTMRWSASQEIEQPWLKGIVDRWVSYRLNTEASDVQSVGDQERAVTSFALWATAKGVRGPEGLTRNLLLAWAAEVNRRKGKTGARLSGSYRAKLVSSVAMMLTFARVNVTDRIPSNAVYLPGELPKADPPRPRFIEPRVIEALRMPASLALIADPSHRVAMQIMMQVGLRSGHTCSLPYDCLIDLNRGGSTDRWALTFVDTKANRQITLPIDAAVAGAVREQQARAATLSKQMGEPAPVQLFPNPRAPISRQLTPEKMNLVLDEWVAALGLCDAQGVPLKLTPHRFRHTFATEMRERGVPLEVVRDLLGHASLSSTEIYATVTDVRMRAEWEKATFINVEGELLELPDGPAADAEWMLHQIGRAVQPLPNGGCALPIQQKCPHANACLDGCPNFVTTPAFLPVHLAQSDEFDRVISKAEAAGHLRIVEINTRPNGNLKKIIRTIRQQEEALGGA